MMKELVQRGRRAAVRSTVILLHASFLLLAGCPQYADDRVPEPIRQVKEPDTGCDYLVYASSRYDAGKPTPLVVLCHGTTPWDSPLRQIRDWVKLAEEKNFIVAAPALRGTRGDFPPAVEKQLQLQRADEEAILAAVRHLRGAYNIERSQVFLTGWSAGGFAILHTGLKHPDIFRALAVLQGNFKSEYLADVVDEIDPYQPVYVLFGSNDVLTGGQGKACLDWLYAQNAYVIEGMVAGPHRAHPQAAYDFFEKIARTVPWMRLRAFSADPNEPFTVQFKVRASFEPRIYTWSFGDGADSPVSSPTHTYAQAGEYTVTLTAVTPNGTTVKRSIRIRVPQATIRHDLDD